jgi:hypothetical protein
MKCAERNEWRTYTVEGREVEMLLIKARWIFPDGEEMLTSIILHDTTDENRDGDAIIAAEELPETDEDAAEMITNEAWTAFEENEDEEIIVRV